MNIILLKHYNILPEAKLAKSLSESNKIKCLLQKDGVLGADLSLIQGADLFVDIADKENATKILLLAPKA